MTYISEPKIPGLDAREVSGSHEMGFLLASEASPPDPSLPGYGHPLGLLIRHCIYELEY
jgi:hypothetical protein